METRKIELTLEQAREYYREGGKLKELALSVYSEKELTLPIIERIKTFEDAVNELGEDNDYVKEYKIVIGTFWSMTSDLKAYLKLRIICAALNEGWKPKFKKEEWRYSPYFYLYTKDELEKKTDAWKKENNAVLVGGFASYGAVAGLVCAYSINSPSATSTNLGSRLCLKSRDLALYCGKQFAHIWADFLLIRK